MTVSLLYPDKALRPAASENRLLYRLSLDRAFSAICPDSRPLAYFLSVLAAMPPEAETAAYRWGILSDFIAIPELFSKMYGLAGRFRELISAHKQNETAKFRLQLDGVSSAAAMKNILQARALSLSRSLALLKGFADLLPASAVHSEGLCAFGNACRRITENESYPRLLSLSRKYEQFSIAGFNDCKIQLDGDGCIAFTSRIDHKHLRITDPDLKRKGFPLFRTREQEAHPCARVYPVYAAFYQKQAERSLGELSALFASLCGQIFDRFGEIYAELDFYAAALQYMAFLTENGIPYCRPQLAEEGGYRITALRDLYLLTDTSPSHVIANDLNTEGKGIAVFGEGGSGKTVFLRSLGCAQLLAQAGLPIPAEEARLPLCTQLAAQFSEAEKEFTAGNEAGRFEQEVRELAAIVDTLQPGATVLLNETFQSTAYAEGAEGLYRLLRHFTACRIRWVLVSHLRGLEEKFSDDEVVILHTAQGYRVW